MLLRKLLVAGKPWAYAIFRQLLQAWQNAQPTLQAIPGNVAARPLFGT